MLCLGKSGEELTGVACLVVGGPDLSEFVASASVGDGFSDGGVVLQSFRRSER